MITVRSEVAESDLGLAPIAPSLGTEIVAQGIVVRGDVTKLHRLNLAHHHGHRSCCLQSPPKPVDATDEILGCQGRAHPCAPDVVCQVVDDDDGAPDVNGATVEPLERLLHRVGYRNLDVVLVPLFSRHVILYGIRRGSPTVGVCQNDTASPLLLLLL